MPRAQVTEFKEEQGFGKLRLEDGTELRFDASVASTFDIQVGDQAEVTLKELGTRTIVRKVDILK